MHHLQFVMRTLYPEEPSDLVLGNGTCFQSSRHKFKCSTLESEGLNPPSRFLFAIHYRFSAALHLFYIEDKIARGWPQHRSGSNPIPLTRWSKLTTTSWRWLSRQRRISVQRTRPRDILSCMALCTAVGAHAVLSSSCESWALAIWR